MAYSLRYNIMKTFAEFLTMKLLTWFYQKTKIDCAQVNIFFLNKYHYSKSMSIVVDTNVFPHIPVLWNKSSIKSIIALNISDIITDQQFCNIWPAECAANEVSESSLLVS